MHRYFAKLYSTWYPQRDRPMTSENMLPGISRETPVLAPSYSLFSMVVRINRTPCTCTERLGCTTRSRGMAGDVAGADGGVERRGGAGRRRGEGAGARVEAEEREERQDGWSRRAVSWRLRTVSWNEFCWINKFHYKNTLALSRYIGVLVLFVFICVCK